MTKAELVEAVQRELDIGRREAVGYVDAVFAAITDGLVADGRVKLNRFGLFVRRIKAARTGRHPRTGAAMPLPAQATVGFRAAPTLKAVLAAARADGARIR